MDVWGRIEGFADGAASFVRRYGIPALGAAALRASAAPITDPAAQTLSNGPTIVQSGAGVPVIHVNAPNGSGISVNSLEQLSVDPLGIIFNNSFSGGTSLVGGAVGGNPNLAGGSARTIVAEVVGNRPSQLNGTLEVFGAPAWLVVANPNGIACNGCGIANAPRFTLAAAQVQWFKGPSEAADGSSAERFGFGVEEGAIDIARGGIEGTRAQVDLVAGYVRSDGPVRAGEALTVRAGPGQVALDDSAAAGGQGSGAGTVYRVDATTFGAMTAGRIDVAVSGEGAGVRSASMLAARAQDLRIHADGSIEVGSAYGAKSIAIESVDGSVKLDGAATLGNFAIDAAGDVLSMGALEAGGDLTVASDGGAIRLRGDGVSGGDLALAANAVSSEGVLAAGGSLSARGDSIVLAGRVQSGGDAHFQGGREFFSSAEMTIGGAADIRADKNLLLAAPVSVLGGLSLSAYDVTLSADLAARGVSVDAARLRLAPSSGRFYVAGDFDARSVQGVEVLHPLDIAGKGSFTTYGNAVFGGSVSAGGFAVSAGGNVAFEQGLTTGGAAAITAGGDFYSGGGISAGSLSVEAGGDTVFDGGFTARGGVGIVAGGEFRSLTQVEVGSFSLKAESADFAGGLISAGDFNLETGALKLGGETLIGGSANLVLTREGFTQSGTFVVNGGLGIDAAKGIELTSEGVGGSVDLLARNGDIRLQENFVAGGAFTAAASGDISARAMSAGGAITLDAGGDVGAEPLVSGGAIAIDAQGQVLAQSMSAREGISLAAGDALSAGSLWSGGAIRVDGRGAVQLGTLEAVEDVVLASGADLQTQTVASGGRIAIDAQGAISAQEMSGAAGISLAAGGEVTAGALLSGGGVDVDAQGEVQLDTVDAMGRIAVTSGAGVTAAAVTSGESIGIDAAGAIQSQAISAVNGIALSAGETIAAGALVSGDGVRAEAVESVQLGTVDAAGRVDLATLSGGIAHGALASGGALAVDSGGGYQVDGSTRVGAAADVVAQGDVDFGGDVGIGGGYSAQVGGALAHRGDTLVLGDADVVATAAASFDGQLEVAGSLDADAAALSIGHDLRAEGQVQVAATAGGVAVGGDLKAGGHVTLDAVGDVGVGGELLAQGDLGVASTAGRIDVGGDLVVLGGGQLSSVSGITLNGASAIVGTGSMDTGGALVLNGDATVGGDLTLQSGHLAARSDVYVGGNLAAGTGTVDDIVGAVIVGGALDLSVTGAVAIAASGSLSVGGSAELQAAGFSNAGQIAAAQDLSLTGGGFTNSAVIVADRLAMNFTGDLYNAGGVLAGDTEVTIQAGGTVTNHSPSELEVGRIQGGGLAIEAGGVINEGEILALDGSLDLDLGAEGLLNEAGATIAASEGIAIATPGDVVVAAPDSYVFADGAVSIEAARFTNHGTVSGLSADTGATQIVVEADTIDQQGSLLAGEHLGLSAPDLSFGGASQSRSYGDLVIEWPGVFQPVQHDIIAVDRLDLQVGSILVGAGDTWSNGSGEVVLGGPLVNYGAINLSGTVYGDIAVLPIIASFPGVAYGVSGCPADAKECGEWHDEIVQRGFVGVGGLVGTLYNLSSDASAGFVTNYAPETAMLNVGWSGLNEDDEPIGDSVAVPDPRGPILFGVSGGPINVLTPNTGVIHGTNFTLTGANIVNGSAAAIAEAGLAFGSAQFGGLGGPFAGLGALHLGAVDPATLTPLSVDPATPTGHKTITIPGAAGRNVRVPETGAPAIAAPTPFAITRPQVLLANSIDPATGLPVTSLASLVGAAPPPVGLAAGTIQGSNITLASSGAVTNFGALDLAGESVIQAATGIENLNGTIHSAGSLALASGGAITNMSGTIAAQDLAVLAASDIVNVSGRISGTESLVVSAGGDLVHATLGGGERAVLEAGEGGLVLEVGGDAAIHNADVKSSGVVSAVIGGDLTVTAQATGETTATTTATPARTAFFGGSSERTTTTTTEQGWEGAQIAGDQGVALAVGGNARLDGATVEAREGSVALIAGGNLTINALATHSETATASRTVTRSGGPDDFTTETVETATTSAEDGLAGGTVHAGGGIVLQAGAAGAGNLSLTGTHLEAGGPLQLGAANDVTLVAGTERSESTATTRQTGPDTACMDAECAGQLQSVTIAEQAATETRVGQLSGSQIAITAGQSGAGSLTLEGITAQAGSADAPGALTLKAADAITVTGAVERSSAEQTVSSTGGGGPIRLNGGNVTTQASQTETLTGSLSGSTVAIQSSGGAVTLAGVPVTASEGALIAGQSVTLGTVETESSQRSVQGRARTETTHTTQTGVTVSAGGNVLIVADHTGAGRDHDAPGAGQVTMTGATVEAGGDLTILGTGGVTLGAAVDTATTDRERGRNWSWERDETVVGTQLAAGTAPGEGAPGNLLVVAGTPGGDTPADLTITGGALSAPGAVTLIAQGNVTLDAARERDESESYSVKTSSSPFSDKITETYTHILDDRAVGTRVESGGSLNIVAGGNLLLEGAQLSTQASGTLTAGGDTVITAAQDLHAETRRRETTKSNFLSQLIGPLSGILPDSITKMRRSDTHEGFDTLTTGSQVTSLEGDLAVESGGDLAVIGSRLEAAGDLELAAATVTISGALDEHRNRRTVKQSGDQFDGVTADWGEGVGHKSKETTDTWTTTVNRGGLEAGGDIRIEAREGDVTLAGTRVEAGGTLAIEAEQLNLAAIKTTDYAAKEAKGSDILWQSMSGKGHHDETAQHTQLDYGQLRLEAQKVQVDGLPAQLEALSGQPGMDWVKDLQQVANIDWQAVAETHERWHYDQEGLTPAAAVIVTAVVSYFTAGAASGAIASATSATAGSTMAAATATTAAGWGNIALSAAVAAMASNASVQLLNNQGDVGAALEATFSDDALKSYLVVGITAGLTAGLIDQAFGADTNAVTGTTQGLDLSSLEGLGRFAGQAGARAVTSAGVDAAITGGSFEEKLAAALTGQAIHVVSAASFNQVGDLGMKGGSIEKIAVKALVGGLISQASGGDFATGALAAGANEALVGRLAELMAEGNQSKGLLTTASRLIGAVSGAITGGDAQLASNLASYDTQYNFLSHDESARRQRLREEQQACGDDACRADKQTEIDRLNRLDAWRDEQISQACKSPASGECQAWAGALNIAAKSYEGQWGNAVDTAERSSVQQQAFKYQQAVNDPFLHGVGVGLLKLSPPGLAFGAVGGIAATVESLVDHGAAQTLINTVEGIAGLPADLKARLNSSDPTVRGEALVDVVSLGLGGGAITAGGAKLTINATQKAAIAREVAKAEAEAMASARQYGNFYRDGAPVVLPAELTTSSGVVIRANPDRTTTILGSFGKDTGRIINDELGLPKSVVIDGSSQPGSFNLLNTPDRVYQVLGPEGFWEEVNRPWLDAAMRRGDDIVLATKPSADSLNRLLPDGTIVRSGFGREYDYLLSHGYRYDSSSGMMVKESR